MVRLDSRTAAGTYPNVLPKEGTEPIDTHAFLSWYYNETFRWWRDASEGANRPESTDFFALSTGDKTRIRWKNWIPIL